MDTQHIANLLDKVLGKVVVESDPELVLTSLDPFHPTVVHARTKGKLVFGFNRNVRTQALKPPLIILIPACFIVGLSKAETVAMLAQVVD